MAERFPLSPMQQGMLFHSLCAETSGAHILQITCELREPIQAGTLEAAWRELMKRHPILRTGYYWEGPGEPWQEARPEAELSLKVNNWRGFTAREQQQHLETFLREERREGFDLSQPPLMRVALIQLDPERHQMVWTLHHVLVDGRSLGLLLQELFEVYEALQRGETPDLPPPPPPYREFIAWLQRQDTSRAEAFWREYLRGFKHPTKLELGTFAAPSPGESGDYAEQEIRVEAAETASLRAFARAHGLTLNTLLQGTWALLLGRYSNSEEVVFGAVRGGRRSTVPGAETMIGLFINTVPVRARLDGATGVLPWLQSLRRQWVALREYEHYAADPGAKLGAKRRGGQALFETIINVQDPAWDVALREGDDAWRRRPLRIVNQTNYPLAVDVYGGPELRIKLLYDRRRWADGSIDRMLRQFTQVLTSLPARGEIPLGAVALAHAGRAAPGAGRHGTKPRHPTRRTAGCPSYLKPRRSKRPKPWPSNVDGAGSLIANSIIEPTSSVLICERWAWDGKRGWASAWSEAVTWCLALLGIWKAGAAYVPLDPTYPKDRLEFMFKDAQMPLVLTHQKYVERMPEKRNELDVLGRAAVDLDVESVFGRQPGVGGLGGRPGVRDLYLRFHRHPQRSGDSTPRPGQSGGLAPADLPDNPRRPGPPRSPARRRLTRRSGSFGLT